MEFNFHRCCLRSLSTTQTPWRALVVLSTLCVCVCVYKRLLLCCIMASVTWCTCATVSWFLKHCNAIVLQFLYSRKSYIDNLQLRLYVSAWVHDTAGAWRFFFSIWSIEKYTGAAECSITNNKNLALIFVSNELTVKKKNPRWVNQLLDVSHSSWHFFDMKYICKWTSK